MTHAPPEAPTSSGELGDLSELGDIADDSDDEIGTEEFSDDELAGLALAADPGASLGDDAVSVWTALGIDRRSPLPPWYMPTAVGGTKPGRGWRRRSAVIVIVAFLVINAYGLCNTYGDILNR